MKGYTSETIRNIALVGHGSTGKTTFLEACLLATGVISRLGQVENGSHIRVLLLTLFYRFFKPIVEAGHVYAAQPPLFRIMHGKTRKYVLNEEEKEKYLASLDEKTRSRAEIARMKGLGEMDAEELCETTMDIEKRVLRKITVEDCIEADKIFEKLMGDEVEPRRLFIEENAHEVDNLDI